MYREYTGLRGYIATGALVQDCRVGQAETT